ncbi:MAG: hypothetical protein GX483_08990 [Actinomycetaceae bacterium]|nr:hypothetical protein [Actinomycetaceae bacterium]
MRKVSADCSRKATWSACDHLAAISKQQVPLDTGALKDSCAVSVNADGTQAVVSYDTPYAVRQHEYTGYRHQRGRKAKYLEDPCNDTSVQNEMIEITKRIYKEGM